MNRHKNLDAILKYLSTYKDGLALKPERIMEKAGLKIEKAESYLMLRLLMEDDNVYAINNKALYQITYRGIMFLDNGGYVIKHRIYKRKMLAQKISDYVDIVVKPIGILTGILVIVWTSIQIYKYIFPI